MEENNKITNPLDNIVNQGIQTDRGFLFRTNDFIKENGIPDTLLIGGCNRFTFSASGILYNKNNDNYNGSLYSFSHSDQTYGIPHQRQGMIILPTTGVQEYDNLQSIAISDRDMFTSWIVMKNPNKKSISIKYSSPSIIINKALSEMKYNTNSCQKLLENVYQEQHCIFAKYKKNKSEVLNDNILSTCIRVQDWGLIYTICFSDKINKDTFEIIYKQKYNYPNAIVYQEQQNIAYDNTRKINKKDLLLSKLEILALQKVISEQSGIFPTIYSIKSYIGKDFNLEIQNTLDIYNEIINSKLDKTLIKKYLGDDFGEEYINNFKRYCETIKNIKNIKDLEIINNSFITNNPTVILTKENKLRIKTEYAQGKEGWVYFLKTGLTAEKELIESLEKQLSFVDEVSKKLVINKIIKSNSGEYKPEIKYINDKTDCYDPKFKNYIDDIKDAIVITPLLNLLDDSDILALHNDLRTRAKPLKFIQNNGDDIAVGDVNLINNCDNINKVKEEHKANIENNVIMNLTTAKSEAQKDKKSCGCIIF